MSLPLCTETLSSLENRDALNRGGQNMAQCPLVSCNLTMIITPPEHYGFHWLDAKLERCGRSMRRLGVVLLLKISLDLAIRISLMAAQIEQSLLVCSVVSNPCTILRSL